jgi:hypothetical protein
MNAGRSAAAGNTRERIVAAAAGLWLDRIARC